MLEQPLYRAWTKAIRGGGGELRSGMRWIGSRRGWLKIFPDRVECGDWTIANSSIREAVLYKSRQELIPVSVLWLATTEATYQFGFNPWVQLERHLCFPFQVEYVKIKRSAFSVIVRLVALGVLLSWLWRAFVGGTG